jgi:hypothetical protein
MTTRVEFAASLGLTLTASLFAVNSDTIVATADTVTEQANAKGMYVAEFSETLIGAHLLVAFDAGVGVSASYCYTIGTATTLRSGNYADVVAAYTNDVLQKVAMNRTVTDPVAGTMTVYADDDVTPLLVAPLFENVAETQPYRGRGAEVRGRLA